MARVWDDKRLYVVLLTGVVAVSFAAIFIRLADAPSLVIATYRLTLAALILAPLALWRCWREFKALGRNDVLWALLSGVLLTLHFVLWIASLDHTTVASSVVFVATNPLFAGIAAHLLRQDRLSPVMFAGIILAVLGGMVIAWDDVALGGPALWGDLLALMGAAMAAGYFMAGRALRPKVSLLAYVSIVYSIAALGALLVSALARQTLFGYSPQTYLMFVLLAVGPQLIGHSSLNWALRHLSASSVGVITLGEPVGSTILAYFFLQETPTLLKIGGAALILAGIYYSLREQGRERGLTSQA
ncbi:MAG TPA: DMT family transporter [Anaerolineae bacterium]|nr:DMT family transporter [Anaerolineae bacterium]